MSVTNLRLYQSVDIENLCRKQGLSLTLEIAASKAQSPVPGLVVPCLNFMPCLCALACKHYIRKDKSDKKYLQLLLIS